MADGNLGITGIQNYLRMKLFSHDFCEHNCGPNPLEDVTRKVTQLIEQSIKERESNSFLIVGPQGVGKSTVVNKALLSFGKQHQDKFHLVSLNGFVHTDDHLSLKAIIKQLNVDVDVDTDDDSIDGHSQIKSFAASMNYILEKLHSGSKESTFIVFVLDEFHMFTLHKNQILLYNLFDICQSPVNPVLIIGLTTQPNVVESLEKRVKSRFSHRQVFLFPKIEFDDYLEIFSSLVSLPLSDDRVSSFTNCKEWNKQIEELLHDKEVLELLRRLFDHSSNYYIMKQFVTYAISAIGYDGCNHLTVDLLKTSSQFIWHDSKSNLISDLNIIELSLLVACKHVDEKGEHESLNFELIYEEYSKYAMKNSLFMSKPILLKALRKLIQLGLLYLSSSSVKHLMEEYQSLHLNVHQQEIIEAVKSYANCPTDLYHWATTTNF